MVHVYQTFHANCIQWRRFAWNEKSCFSGKNKKNINLLSAEFTQNVVMIYVIYHMMMLLFSGVTSCHKNRMTTNYITLWREQVTSWWCPCQPCIFCRTIVNFKVDKIQLKMVICDKQNLTLLIISYRIYETCWRNVRSSINAPMLSMLGKNFNRRHSEIFFPEKKFDTSCKTNLH